MENGKEPINPHLVHTMSGEAQEYSKGLTKREYFAGLAMVSCSQREMTKEEIQDLAQNAVLLADELLKQLDTNPSNK